MSGAARNTFGGPPILRADKVDPSYLLLATLNTGDHRGDEGFAHLTDLTGAILHTWKTGYETSVAHLQKNGDLFVAQLEPNRPDTSHFPGGGRTGILQRLDWRGTVLWEYRHEAMHHDFEVLPNGNVVVTVWEHIKPEIARAVVSDERAELWCDALLEVTPRGDVVWEWHAQDHLDPKSSLLNEFPHRIEWTHINSVRHVPKNPVNGEEALLVSMRNTNAVYLISKKTKRVIWSSEQWLTAGQHDATLTPEGTVLVFDNALHRRPTSRSEVVASRVIEIDPRTNAVTWELTGGPSSSERASFYSSIMCGAQRLENGNTLVVLSSPGHLLEVTPEKETVWDFINPFTTKGTGLWPNNAVFTARRYRAESLDVSERLPPPF